MKMVTDMIKIPQLNKTMAEMSREMMKAGMIDEVMDDAIDSALDSEEMEEETEAEVDKVGFGFQPLWYPTYLLQQTLIILEIVKSTCESATSSLEDNDCFTANLFHFAKCHYLACQCKSNYHELLKSWKISLISADLA